MRLQTMWQGTPPVFPAEVPCDAALRAKRAISLCSQHEPEQPEQPEARRHRPTARRAWTEEENAILLKRYPKEGASERLQELTGRDAQMLRSQATRLGLRVNPKVLARKRKAAFGNRWKKA